MMRTAARITPETRPPLIVLLPSPALLLFCCPRRLLRRGTILYGDIRSERGSDQGRSLAVRAGLNGDLHVTVRPAALCSGSRFKREDVQNIVPDLAEGHRGACSSLLQRRCRVAEADVAGPPIHAPGEDQLARPRGRRDTHGAIARPRPWAQIVIGDPHVDGEWTRHGRRSADGHSERSSSRW